MWIHFKEFFIDLVHYGFPTIAIILSVISFIMSRKAGKVQNRLIIIEEKLKKYELEEKEKERVESTKACVEARITKYSTNNYKMKVWNSGKATAYNVDLIISDEYKGLLFKEKTPYEFLEAGKSYEEIFIVNMGTPRKSTLTTTWKDKEGVSYSKEQIVSVP
jgi:hypothetical protein